MALGSTTFAFAASTGEASTAPEQWIDESTPARHRHHFEKQKLQHGGKEATEDFSEIPIPQSGRGIAIRANSLQGNTDFVLKSYENFLCFAANRAPRFARDSTPQSLRVLLPSVLKLLFFDFGD
jgi:hypothetical protein